MGDTRPSEALFYDNLPTDKHTTSMEKPPLLTATNSLFDTINLLEKKANLQVA